MKKLMLVCCMLLTTLSLIARSHKKQVSIPQQCQLTTHCTLKTDRDPRLNEQFYSAMNNFKKRCNRCNSGPLCKIFNDVTNNITIDEINEVHVKTMVSSFQQDPFVKDLTQKIKTCLQEDPEVCKDIECIIKNGDKKSCCRFEKHLHAKARQHCGIGCLFNRNKMDTCMAAVFCAAMECFEPSNTYSE